MFDVHVLRPDEFMDQQFSFELLLIRCKHKQSSSSTMPQADPANIPLHLEVDKNDVTMGDPIGYGGSG